MIRCGDGYLWGLLCTWTCAQVIWLLDWRRTWFHTWCLAQFGHDSCESVQRNRLHQSMEKCNAFIFGDCSKCTADEVIYLKLRGIASFSLWLLLFGWANSWKTCWFPSNLAMSTSWLSLGGLATDAEDGCECPIRSWCARGMEGSDQLSCVVLEMAWVIRV